MKTVVCALALLVLLLAGIGSACAGEVLVVPVKGEISEARFYFLRRALKEAEKRNVDAVVLDMDTYGGELKAAQDIQKALAQVKARTLTFVNPNAWSAGALIAISTRDIYMAPVSGIGAAAPVGAGGEDLPKTLSDKVISATGSYYRSVAERNGHNPDIAQAFIDRNTPVVVAGKTLHAAGSILSFSARQATEKIDGKPVLAAGIADSIDDLLKQAKLTGAVVRMEPSGFEHMAFWITTLAPLFLLGGILGAWIEFKLPGIWIPGGVSAVCFTIFFTGHYVAGLAGWEAPVLFVLGLALVIGELTIHPGTIIPGFAGAALMAGSLVWAMVDRYPGQGWWPDSAALFWPMLNLGTAFVLACLAIAALARYLPQTNLYHQLVLAARSPTGPSLPPMQSEFTRVNVGDEGKAASILRPSGRAVICGESFDVITRGDFVEPGTPLRVVAVEGMRIVVESMVG